MLVCVTGRAGATAGVNCSLCQAGTYGTGSGEGLRNRFGSDPHVIHTIVLAAIFVFAFSFLALQLYTAC
jgi:hypothetical protein